MRIKSEKHLVTRLNLYIKEVLNGKKTTGTLEKLAARRFLNDKKSRKYKFDSASAFKAVDYIQMLTHTEGVFFNRPFELEPWELFLVANIFGWINRKTKYRRFRYVHLEVARKNGKSTIIGAIAAYMVVEEQGAENILTANSREQASILLKHTTNFIKKLDEKSEHFNIYKNSITLDASSSFIKVLASDSSKIDGYNPHLAVIDEIHEARSSSVYDVLRSGQGSRMQPCLITITTAGFEKTRFAYTLREKCIKILQGIEIDDSYFTMIFSLDDTDDWTDPKNFIKANPNLGVSISEEYLINELQNAESHPSREVAFKTKNLNMWVDSAVVWITDKVISAHMTKTPPSNLHDWKQIVAIDLSNSRDITAVCQLYVDESEGKFYLKWKFYLPKMNIKYNSNYAVWNKQGFLTLTEGNIIDYDYIKADIFNIKEPIDTLVFDPWGSPHFIPELLKVNPSLNVSPFGQKPSNMNIPTREFERLLETGNILMEYNPIFRWMVSNTLIETRGDAVRPSKDKSKNKIDGVVAAIMGLGQYLHFSNLASDIKQSPYNDIDNDVLILT